MIKRILKFFFGNKEKVEKQSNTINLPKPHMNISMSKPKENREEKIRHALAEVFEKELNGEDRPSYNDVEWQTILVCDGKSGMGRIVTLTRKGRDQSEEWESLLERDRRIQREKEDLKDKLYHEGKFFKPTHNEDNKRYKQRFLKQVRRDGKLIKEIHSDKPFVSAEQYTEEEKSSRRPLDSQDPEY